MNEQRRSFHDYTNPKRNKHREIVDEVLEVAHSLLQHRSLLPMLEKFYVDNVIKQLNQRNAKIPDNVLRGMKRKLQNMQKQIKR